MTQPRLRILACQVDIPEILTAEARDEHVKRIIGLAKQQADAVKVKSPDEPVDLIVFPEICTISYSKETFDNIALLAEKVPLPEDFGDVENADELLHHSPTTLEMRGLATATGALVCFGIPRVCKQGDAHRPSYRISQCVVRPADGGEGAPPVFCVYDKMHVCNDPRGTYCEGNYFSPKSKEDPPQHRGLQVFSYKGFRIAMTICYDFRFPGLFNAYAKHHKADIFLHPCAFPKDDTFYNRNAFVVTRAVENVSYVLSLNRAGCGWGRTLFASPWVSGPEGASPLLEFDDAREQLEVVEVSKEVLNKQRAQTIYMEECLETYDSLDFTETSC